MDARAEEVLSFWFGELKDDYDLGTKGSLWWKKDPEVDREIRERFGDLIERGVAGELDDWAEEPRSCLALIIVLDQFSRNVFRDDPRAWAQDEKAQRLCLDALEAGHDRVLAVVEKQFLTMPLMHAEDRELLKRCCDYAEQVVADIPDDRMQDGLRSWVKFAEAHRVIIDRFGRYPHRNAVLGRETTPEEAEFLKQPGSSF